MTNDKPSLDLTPRALAAWAGTDRLSAVVHRLPQLASDEPLPAAQMLALFVAGRDVPAERAPTDPRLVERIGDRARAKVAVLPLGRALLVCDRADAPPREDTVCWPDDSSYHLAGALPRGRNPCWLDIGCGSAFAQLYRPELAERKVALDINPRAVAYARLGGELSRIALEVVESDAGALPDCAPQLVTCNAPMPMASGPMVWRRADPGLFERLFRAIPACLAQGGLAVVHCARAAIPADLPGERVIASYAPEFAVLRWRPDGPTREIAHRRDLTVDRPHLDEHDFVLASTRGA